MTSQTSADSIVCSDLSIAHASGRGTPERVVDGVSFTLARGAALILVGATGSGKSTLATVLAGTAGPGVGVVGGDAVVEGVSVRRPGRRLRLLTVVTGYLGQTDGATLPARLTVGDIVAEPVTSRQRKVNGRALSFRVATLLDELGLPLGAVGKYPYELSAGMRQRVAIARTLMLEPRLVVADEPLANLDVEAREIVRSALERRQRDAGMSLLLVANEPENVARFDADVLALRAGHTVGFGHGVESMTWTPSSEADRRLVSS
ncbi:ATP-binding cassette domain-containing protein [Microbacterium sp. 18062]|uniref:ATP-binding cassette domain-containing protein n=1 Tax=Microbacterium sp. 18062 TaxID=2681410 RepID=UPI00135BD6A3|nr:ATP-binding cassette domain-containing protein [Microbacterium sp. 18062]